MKSQRWGQRENQGLDNIELPTNHDKTFLYYSKCEKEGIRGFWIGKCLDLTWFLNAYSGSCVEDCREARKERASRPLLTAVVGARGDGHLN